MKVSAGKRIEASVYIICRDEARTIGDCLASVARFSDIVVVDSGSTDGTLAIVEKHASEGLPIRLFQREWPGYAEQKQFALEACGLDWCLNLDADEAIDDRLADAIAAAIASGGEAVAYDLTRREWLPGYGFVHPWARQTRIRRLINRNFASYDKTQVVHESVDIRGPAARLRKGNIWHRPYLDIEQIVAKQNRYSTLKAQMAHANGKAGRPWKMLTSPLGSFFKHYVLKRYFLCGWPGFAISVLSAQYSFMAAWKLWAMRTTAGEGGDT